MREKKMNEIFNVGFVCNIWFLAMFLRTILGLTKQRNGRIRAD